MPSAEVKTYRLFIKPQTHIRTVKGERWLTAEKVTDKYLMDFGMKKYNQRVAEKRKHLGSPLDYLNRKRWILKYFDYKKKLFAEARKAGLIIFPLQNVWIKFYLPMPVSWSKKKRNAHCFELHSVRPDIDNFSKGVFDSLLKEDNFISDFRASKFWYDGPGHIEIEIGSLPPAIGYKKIIREEKIK